MSYFLSAFEEYITGISATSSLVYVLCEIKVERGSVEGKNALGVFLELGTDAGGL